MKNREVWTITSNEEFVRHAIYEGRLQISDAGAELVRMARQQNQNTEASKQREIDGLLGNIEGVRREIESHRSARPTQSQEV